MLPYSVLEFRFSLFNHNLNRCLKVREGMCEMLVRLEESDSPHRIIRPSVVSDLKTQSEDIKQGYGEMERYIREH